MPDDVKTVAATPEQAAAQVASQMAAGQLPTEVTVSDGKGGQQVYKGASPAELLQKIAEAAGNKNEHIARIERENAEFRQEIGGIKDTQKKLAQVFAPPSGADQPFDRAKFYDLFERDPQAAWAYVREYDEDYKQMRAATETAQGDLLARTFLYVNPDFSNSPDDTKKITEFVTQNGLSIGNLTHLQMAYDHLVRRGQITPKPGSKATGPNPPPNIPSSAPALSGSQQDQVNAIWKEQDLNKARELVMQSQNRA